MLPGVWAGFHLVLGRGGVEESYRFRLNWVQNENTSKVDVLFLITLNSVLFSSAKMQSIELQRIFFFLNKGNG